MMVRALWNGQVIAESDATVEMEGNHYFPPDAIYREFFEPSDKIYNCSWKGKCHYMSIIVDGKKYEDGAWYYPLPMDEAKEIKGRFAFEADVKVEIVDDFLAPPA